MENGIGKFIKSIAIVGMVLGAFAGCILAAVLGSSLGDIGIAIGFGVAIALFIVEMPLYVLGHIVENLEAQTKNLEKMNNTLFEILKNSKNVGASAFQDAKPAAAMESPAVSYKPAAPKQTVSQPPAASKNIPLHPIEEDGHILCPTCKKAQPAEQYYCISCGQLFVNGQPGIPFWCGTCGKEGPYDGKCPCCGSSIKVPNRFAPINKQVAWVCPNCNKKNVAGKTICWYCRRES